MDPERVLEAFLEWSCKDSGSILEGFWGDAVRILGGFCNDPGSILEGLWKDS